MSIGTNQGLYYPAMPYIYLADSPGAGNPYGEFASGAKSQYTGNAPIAASTANTTYMFMFRQTSGTGYVSVNGGTETSFTCPVANLTTTPYWFLRNAGATGLVINRMYQWNVALSSTQRSTFYNSGAGHYYNGTVWV